MTRRTLLLTLGIWSLAAVSIIAQRGANADPLSGTWTGTFAPKNGPPPVDVVMHLTFDGKRTVTGTFTGLPSPGDVKHGTFDAKTGTLTLELGKVGEAETLLTLDGVLAKDAAKGTFSGELSGDFSLVRKP